MKTYVQKTNDKIKELELSYSPELFSKILKEIKSCPINIEEEKRRQESLRAFDKENTRRKRELAKINVGRSTQEITANW